ncbi:helix-turn-helix transcriptional regulator [Spongiactinospora sp. TRM90649]|uniref:helix-turn-helix domain-containing protein n=1 Tax=Spongiactinospora sp. TRM90649 TaxID=3031114 RepID=UPI0023F61BD4|nr:helix-turn-helix transcriptional regulator [Spongiactinospora sp. TRM90649]MDF5756204.1 helix-turn-helix transcriptional regulator [Spongiactinospora sp. TRM90649]
MSTEFGRELRRRRLAAGLSLRELSDGVRFDRGYLSKVETGVRAPSRALADACDEYLMAKGALTRLSPERAGRGAGSDPRWSADGPGESYEPDGDVVATFETMLGQHRRLGQQLPPRLVLRQASEQVRTLRALAVPGPLRPRVLLLAARYAEYAGWMAQESGDVPLAWRWTAYAVRLAGRAGDRTMAAHAHVRRAGLALYAGDADEVIGLSLRALAAAPGDSRIHKLATQRQAQGHALRGETGEVERLLDGAAVLSPRPAGPYRDGMALGSATVFDQDAAVAGWCYHDLGRYGRAVDLLEPVVEGLPPWARRARGRFGSRLARAQLGAGRADAACATGFRLIERGDGVASATLATELRLLTGELSAWRARYAPAGDLARALSDLLRVPA